jgi:diadenosine tetraphosphate (Ap4A) HIT family hydrolase
VETDCVFCEIVAGHAPASTVYRDERVVAFMDIGPVTPGHLMVVPLAHVAGLEDLDPDLGAHVFVVASRLAGAIRRSGLRCDGINLFLADGEAAFQEVFHAHLHVIPRWPGDGFTVDSPAWSREKPSREALDADAAAIRAALHLTPATDHRGSGFTEA